MCGRFTLRKDTDALAAHFAIDKLHPISQRYNIAPTQSVAVVRANPFVGKRELVIAKWGLDPPWAATDIPARPIINARAETLATKPSFRELFRYHRCLIPADGFYEWQQDVKGKQPWFIHLPGDALFSFAGLWKVSTKADETHDVSCAIITTAPLPLLARLHNRMPVILAAESYRNWLDPEMSNPAMVAPMLTEGSSYAMAERLQMHPVRVTVNRVQNDTPDCIVAN